MELIYVMRAHACARLCAHASRRVSACVRVYPYVTVDLPPYGSVTRYHVQYVGHIDHVLHVWNLHMSCVRIRVPVHVRVRVLVCPRVSVCNRRTSSLRLCDCFMIEGFTLA